jgi:hypothetical protein
VLLKLADGVPPSDAEVLALSALVADEAIARRSRRV